MLLLILFAVVVGAGTAISPCVLPVLPAMLSASGAGGARRPLGIVLGLTTTFAITIIGIAKVVDGVGFGSDPLRDLAIVVLALFGIALIVPQLGQLAERPLAALSRLGPRTRGDGFFSGLLVGGALGFVYTPCAGPILAAVISVGAASGRAVLVGSAYALGTGLMLLALALGGRRILDRLRRAGRALAVQRALGVVMVATALVIATMLDVKLDELIAEHIPSVNITAAIDDSSATRSKLKALHHTTNLVAIPRSTSGMNITVPCATMRRSQEAINRSPPPTAAPCTCAIVTACICSIASHRRAPICPALRRQSQLLPFSTRVSAPGRLFRSAPAEKARPAPLKIDHAQLAMGVEPAHRFEQLAHHGIVDRV